MPDVQPTNNPVPSDHPADARDNFKIIDEFVNSKGILTSPSRTGRQILTLSRYNELVNPNIDGAEAAAVSAAESAAAAEAAASGLDYQGLWPDTGGSANKGDTYQTQVGGTPTGQYFTALQNTTIDPIGDDVNWRGIVSVAVISKVYKASGGNSAVENMIDGVPISASIGDAVKCEYGSSFKRISESYGDINDFELMSDLIASDIGILTGGVTGATSLYNQYKSLPENSGHAFYLSGSGVVFFDGSRPDLTGPFWKVDPDITVRVEEHPDTSQFMKYLTPITIEDPVLMVTQLKPANVQVPYELYNSGAGNQFPTVENYTSLNVSDFETTNITNYNTRSVFGGNVTSDKFITWSTQQAEESGMFKSAYVGEFYEATFLCTGPLTSSGGNQQSVSVITDKARYIMRNYVGASTVDFLEIRAAGGITVLKTIADLPFGGVFGISPEGGSITSAVRIVSRNKIEFYINDVIFGSFDIDGDVQEVGFTANPAATLPSQGNQIVRPFVATDKIPKGSKEINVACIGDSITFGSWDNITWPQLLSSCAQNMHGIGRVNVDNFAVGGKNWAYYGSGGGSTIDYTPYDYVLIQLGTNDVQGNTNPTNLELSVNTVLQKIIDDGAVPVVSMFPIWTTIANTGTGVNAVNPEKAGKFRAQIKDLALAKGAIIANALTYFGANESWLSDNIHPSTEGQVSIATAFAAAIKDAVESPQTEIGESSKIYLPLSGTWTNFNEATHEPLSISVDNSGTVTIQGSISGGSVGNEIAVIPERYRPSRRVISAISANGAFGEMVVAPAGDIVISVGDTSGIVSLSSSFKIG